MAIEEIRILGAVLELPAKLRDYKQYSDLNGNWNLTETKSKPHKIIEHALTFYSTQDHDFLYSTREFYAQVKKQKEDNIQQRAKILQQ